MKNQETNNINLTEKQKNCPYCHGGNDHQPIYDSNRRSQKFSVNLKHENDKHHPHMLVISCKGDTSAADYDWDGDYHEVPIKYWASINYSPMCGRLMNEEED